MQFKFVPLCLAVLCNILYQVNLNTGISILDICSEMALRILITLVLYELFCYLEGKIKVKE